MSIGQQSIAPFASDFAGHSPDIQRHLTPDDRFAEIVGEGQRPAGH
jgi:hypothetical protein